MSGGVHGYARNRSSVVDAVPLYLSSDVHRHENAPWRMVKWAGGGKKEDGLGRGNVALEVNPKMTRGRSVRQWVRVGGIRKKRMRGCALGRLSQWTSPKLDQTFCPSFHQQVFIWCTIFVLQWAHAQSITLYAAQYHIRNGPSASHYILFLPPPVQITPIAFKGAAVTAPSNSSPQISHPLQGDSCADQRLCRGMAHNIVPQH